MTHMKNPIIAKTANPTRTYTKYAKIDVIINPIHKSFIKTRAESNENTSLVIRVTIFPTVICERDVELMLNALRYSKDVKPILTLMAYSVIYCI